MTHRTWVLISQGTVFHPEPRRTQTCFLVTQLYQCTGLFLIYILPGGVTSSIPAKRSSSSWLPSTGPRTLLLLLCEYEALHLSFRSCDIMTTICSSIINLSQQLLPNSPGIGRSQSCLEELSIPSLLVVLVFFLSDLCTCPFIFNNSGNVLSRYVGRRVYIIQHFLWSFFFLGLMAIHITTVASVCPGHVWKTQVTVPYENCRDVGWWRISLIVKKHMKG